ncbi:pyridoxal phosphate-dependent aminotransferase [Rickettsia asembonensis]|uniref:pyridoxal phosphate-dependent aminotransferase n=1 Tax=Rickettsia asembonensis TaxID=1068590 RepID=UPI0023F6991A|nr:histidinol-phosphate transaminase [Rickettsia asembonensis]WCR56958.1 MAG: Histidinol-phosphate aminotransferase [Rickettsia asembonensis]
MVGAGANQLLEDVLKIYALNQGIIVLSVTFPESVACITTLGGYAKTISLKTDFTLDLKALLTGLEPDIALIHICNPNNPTGIWHSPRELISLADDLTVPLVVSEASADFIGNTILNHAIHKNIILVRSFSKAYGLAGLRMGYIVASEERINYMKRRLGSYRANSFGIAGAIAALQDSEHLNSSVNYLLQEKLYLMDSLKALGFEVIPSHSQTFIAKIPKYFSDATTFCQTIAKYNMAVVNCSLYEGLEQYIRIAPQKHHINKQFILTLTKIIRDLYDN